MLVCPTCRSENLEEARFCSSCGRSLAPEDAAMVRGPRGDRLEELIDVPAATPRRPLRAIVALATVVVLAAGVAAWSALRPNPCTGKFTSEQFPYCVTVPKGWHGGAVELDEDTTADAFRPRAEGATVLVLARQAEGADTEAFAREQRTAQEAAGLFPSPTKPVEVDGADGLAWGFTDTDADGKLLRERWVALVHGDEEWLIVISGPHRRVVRAMPKFDGMLSSWAWK